MIDALVAGLRAVSPAEALSVVLGLAYLLLAVRRNRWCWAAGAVSSAILGYLSLRARLPMQAALQIYYVAISYGAPDALLRMLTEVDEAGRCAGTAKHVS